MKKSFFFRISACKSRKSGYIKRLLGDYGAVAQLARAIRSHRIGRGFDSLLLHHNPRAISSVG